MSAEASNNGADFEGVGMWFEYVRAAQAGTLSPSRGPIGGGTEVTIRGTAYSTGTDPSCSFGEAGYGGQGAEQHSGGVHIRLCRRARAV